MPIQAADFDTVFEALLDRTAYLLTKIVSYRQSFYATAGAFNHTWSPLCLVADLLVVGGGAGGGGGVSGPSATAAGEGGGGGSSGRWTRSFFVLPQGNLVGFVGAGGTGGDFGTAATNGGDGQTSWVQGSGIYAGEYIEAQGGVGGAFAIAGVNATAGGFGVVPHRGEGMAYGGRGGRLGLGNNSATGESGFNAVGGNRGVGNGALQPAQGGFGIGAGGGGGKPQSSDGNSGGGGGGGGVSIGPTSPAGASGNVYAGGKGATGGVIVREYFAATA